VTGVDNLGDKPSVLILPKGKSKSVRVPLDLGTIVPLPPDEPSETDGAAPTLELK
jgi:hypothetical protein